MKKNNQGVFKQRYNEEIKLCNGKDAYDAYDASSAGILPRRSREIETDNTVAKEATWAAVLSNDPVKTEKSFERIAGHYKARKGELYNYLKNQQKKLYGPKKVRRAL